MFDNPHLLEGIQYIYIYNIAGFQHGLDDIPQLPFRNFGMVLYSVTHQHPSPLRQLMYSTLQDG